MYSNALRKKMAFDIYLPQGYSATRKYPVLYALHGKDGNENSWMNGWLWGFQGVQINKKADQLIAEHRLAPLIIVSPELDNSYGINSARQTARVGDYNRGMYEDYIEKDLIRYVDAHYSTVESRTGRYIGGFSMGGFAALHSAFARGDLFSKTGGYSAALWIGPPPTVLSWLYPNQRTQRQTDPLTIAGYKNLRDVKVFLAHGDRDPFAQADDELYKTLKAHGVTVTDEVRPGGHTYGYWSQNVGDFLLFFGGLPRQP